MKTAEEILSMVNEFLANLPYERKPMSLYEPIRYVLSMGGKRIRPTLMLLGYNLFKDNPEKILMNAVALETYHNYTLLHDDLMDNADLRRGHETVHKKWDANTAILSGDSMLVLSYERMAQCDEKHLAKVLKLFTTTALEIGEGQQFDMEFENRNDVKEEEYITSNKKTYMLINAFNHANDAQRAELQKWVDAKEFNRAEKVAAVTRLYNEIGIDKLAQEKIAYYFEQSKKYLDAVSVPAERKEELAKYAQKMMKRQY